MKKTFTLFIICLTLFSVSAQTPSSIHQFSTNLFTGGTLDLSQYYGKKVMVVNIAAKCGYTPQLLQLHQIYSQYRNSNNFEIIGFPSNDFNQQGTDSELTSICATDHVSFPVTESVHVNTSPLCPVYDWLTKSSQNGVSNATVSWNFNKFLIDEEGHWVAYYSQSTLPNAQVIVDWILSPSVISSAPSLNLDELVEMKSSNPTSTSIDFFVKNSGLRNLNIELFSSNGNLISTIYNGSAEGAQNISYSVTALASGIYFVKMQSDGVQKIVKYSVVN